MTRIFVQRPSSSSSSSSQNHSVIAPQINIAVKEEEQEEDVLKEQSRLLVEDEKKDSDKAEGIDSDNNEGLSVASSRASEERSLPHPPPSPPVPSTEPLLRNLNPFASNSKPSSPTRFYDEGEGYNSGDEHTPHFGYCHDDVRERQFELDINRVMGLEVKRMVEDGNCLFRAVADQVYGDTEAYDLTRQMCVDYMEREQDHFCHFITEGFSSYCKRKRQDKVYGNNIEIQALSEMYNRPIHIYSYCTEPINIFHGSYNTDMPPIRLSYHCGNHYNALIDPRRPTIGAGLGFDNLQGVNIDKDKVKATIEAMQNQQIDNALLAEGRFHSDVELTEKELECMALEVSRAEYLADDKCKKQIGFRGSSSTSKPSSSDSTAESDTDLGDWKISGPYGALGSGMQMMLSMGFSYLQAFEAYSLFGDDMEAMICYLLETDSSSVACGRINRLKGKATE